MENTHAIKARIKSVESIRQITKSMKMVAASKLRRVQSARGALSLMAEKSRMMLEQLQSSSERSDNPFLALRAEKKRVCFAAFVGNRGFCGVYNNALARHLENEMAACGTDCFAVVCGSWGQDVMEGGGMSVKKRFGEFGDVPSAAEAQELTEYLKKLYLNGEADEIVLVYQSFRSVLQQTPVSKTLLPVQPGGEGSGAAGRIFEPDRKTILDKVVELYLNNAVFAAMLEARTGEHAARMTSMTAASDSTDELIRSLRQDLNHARQAAITTELSEIVSGAQALDNIK